MSNILNPATVGDDRAVELTVTKKGVAVDLTGALAIDTEIYDDVASITLGLDSGVAITDGPSGQATITVGQSDWPQAWLDITAKQTVYIETQVTDSAGKRSTLPVVQWQIKPQRIVP